MAIQYKRTENMKFGAALIASTLIFSAPIAMAENEVSIFGGYFFGDTNGAADDIVSFYPGIGETNLSNMMSFGARYTYWAGRTLGFGAEYNQNGYDIESGSGFSGNGTVEFRNFSAIGVVRLPNNTAITPYAGLGVGIRRSELSGSGMKGDASFSPSIGMSGFGGASYQINEYVSLFGELHIDYGARAEADSGATNKARLPGSFNPALNIGASLHF